MAQKSPLTPTQTVLGVIALRLAVLVIAALVLRALPEHATEAESVPITAPGDHGACTGDRPDDLRLRD